MGRCVNAKRLSWCDVNDEQSELHVYLPYIINSITLEFVAATMVGLDGHFLCQFFGLDLFHLCNLGL